MRWRRRTKVAPELAIRVFSRDLGCVAVVLDPAELGKCSGRLTLDHIQWEARKGKRAEDDEEHLVTLCQGHTEDGRKAGHQWNTANRPKLRRYLWKRYGYDCYSCGGFATDEVNGRRICGACWQIDEGVFV